MVIMNLLRILVDVAFYGAFAGLIARACGGSGAFAGLMIQSLCFGLSRLGRNRITRLACLLPMALGWIIYRDSIADCILMIPTAAYIIWLVWTDDYALDNERQKLLFNAFWKLLLVVILLGLLLGGFQTLSAVTVPYALVVLVCSVLLMRALRHEAKVYCSVRYQVMNLSVAAVVAALAGLLSTKAFLNACAAGIRAVYAALIRPILEFLLTLLMYVIGWIVELFAWLSRGNGNREPQDTPQLNLNGAEKIFGENIQMREPGELLRILGYLLLAAVAATLLVLFFRWMSRHRGRAASQVTMQGERESMQMPPRSTKKKETTPVRKVRALYRGFLKWCSGIGVQTDRASTSQDVHWQVSLQTAKGAVSEQIRELYIKARYADDADQNSVKEMKRLCEKLKKPDETA